MEPLPSSCTIASEGLNARELHLLTYFLNDPIFIPLYGVMWEWFSQNLTMAQGRVEQEELNYVSG